MTTADDEFAAYLDSVKEALSAVYNSPDVLDEWQSSEERFIRDHMDLVKATYEAGYLDAIDDLEEKARELARKFP